MPSDFDLDNVLDDWCEAFHKGDYKDCLRIAINAYAGAEYNELAADQTQIIRLIKSSAMLFDGEYKLQQAEVSPRVCSFCRTAVGEKQAVAGLDVLICSDCIKMASTAIK